MKKIILMLLAAFILVGGIIFSDAIAQTNPPPPLGVGLVLDKSTYNFGEKIQAIVSLGNTSGVNKYPPLGFSVMPFHLCLVFTDPDGMVITSNLLRDKPLTDPPPPTVFTDGLVQVEPVELNPVGWRYSVTIPNLYDYYTLTKPGKYSVKAMIPLRTYPAIDYPKNLDVVPPIPYDYSRLENMDWEGHIESIPASSFTVLAAGTASGTINVRAEKHTVGTGSKPPTTKEPINGMLVKAFNMSDSCVARYGNSQHGFSWQNYKPIWDNCAIAASFGVTDQNNTGKVSFPLPPGDYLIIGLYDPDKTQNSGDEIYIGVSAGGLDPGETMNKYLQVIVKVDGKKVPAKYTVVTGSELMIIEPEYIEWDGTKELYPFVFQSVGDWGVTTSVTPPEGFVADQNSLSTEVISELKALQFIITDVGSKWVSSGVTYQLSHNKKKQTIKSKVGIKLSERLARQKGLDKFGNDQSPKK
jgi:hypothetical protein